jgi:hypothetical protein
MGLIDLKTDLKSLKYSSMPLGSDAPYITKDINNPPSSNGFSMQVTKRVDDLSRIAQMLVDKPGLKYLGSEALLQQTHNLGEISKAQNKGKAALKAVKDTIINTAKIAGSTLAQVPVNGTGLHFIKGFNANTYLKPRKPEDNSAFAEFFGDEGVIGAPYTLQGREVPGTRHSSDLESRQKEYPSSYQYDAKIQEPDKTLLELKDNKEQPSFVYQNQISAKLGTPITVAPDGYVQTTEEEGNGTVKGVPIPLISGSVTREQSKKQELAREYTDTDTYIDTQKKIGNSQKDVRRESRVNLGDQGARNDGAKAKNEYWTKTPKTSIDETNALDVRSEVASGIDDGRDFAKLYFEIITPDGSKFLHFRAFIDSIDDGYSADWQAHKYVGRAENFYTYGGFDRDISISFKIAAATRSEMKPLYKKMVYLASSTAPTYSETFMRGTVAKITVGSYFHNIPGVITSVKYSLVEGGQWEIAMRNPETNIDDDEQELPMILQCNVSFKPIHNFAPQTGLYHYFTNSESQYNSKPFFTQGQDQ